MKRTDTERLDWIERAKVNIDADGDGGWERIGEICRSWFVTFCDERDETRFDNLRAAIDAAMDDGGQDTDPEPEAK